MNKKNMSKSIAIALAGITIITPALGIVHASELNTTSKINENIIISNIDNNVDVNSLSNEEFAQMIKSNLIKNGATVEDVEIKESDINERAFKACKGKNKCDGTCTGRKCGIWKVQKVRVRYTNSEAKKVYEKARFVNIAARMGGLVMDAVGKPIPGVILAAYGDSVGSFRPIFKKAIDKKTGVTFEYEYCIHVINASSFGRNSRTIYK